jgi:hypothetical protein
LYGGVFTASATYGTVSYIQSRKYYSSHLVAETFRESSVNYNKANSHHKGFIIATGICAASFLANVFHVNLLDNMEKKLNREIYDNYKERPLDSKEFCTIKIVPGTENGIGLALLMEF